MSKTTLMVGALAVSLVAGVHAADTETGKAELGKKVDPTRMTCEEFVALQPEAQPRIVAWLAGYAQQGKAIEEKVVAVPVEADVATVVTACNEAPKQSVWERIRGKLPFAKKSVTDPTKMTCQEFVGLGKDVQPMVTYWIQGYDRGGKATATGSSSEPKAAAVPTGADADTMVVVDECRATPNASLRDKVKKSS